MPVEIRELVIRAVITAEADQATDSPSPAPAPTLDQEALIQACVKQVLRIIKKKEDR